jgi:hypothetical protein
VGGRRFFYAGHGVGITSLPDIPLECYKLAKFYGVHPDTFLVCDLRTVMRHRARTNQVLAELGEDDDG